FIYFGGGVSIANAQEEMLALAEKIDSPIACSLMGLSTIPSDHPRFLGMQGMHGNIAANKAMQRADLIICLGARFNDRATGNRHKFALNTRIVHIDIDGSELNKTVNASTALRGDLKLTLSKLLPLINETKKPEWTAKIENLKRDEEEASDRRDGMTPKNVILALNKRLGENTAVCTDVGQHQMWSAQNLTFKKCRRFITSGGLGTMGFGLGAAIGAYFGTKEPSVLITGDGGFGMSLNELATAVSYKVPVVIIIMNNGVLGMVRQWQTLFFDKHYSGTVLDRKTNFSQLAKAFGADGEAVSSISEFVSALENAFNQNGPYVIDCAIDKDELVFPMLPPGGSMDDIIVQ
ncbi:MAG: acetolactate synthase large subunit, partial [Clostridia bacterium]|nr:acetolactate synthase large subunit [Clostridia bacterium]